MAGFLGELSPPNVTGRGPNFPPFDEGASHKLPMHVVRPDVFTKIEEAWRRLLDRGYRRIGVALPVEPTNELDGRRIGVRARVKAGKQAMATDLTRRWLSLGVTARINITCADYSQASVC